MSVSVVSAAETIPMPKWLAMPTHSDPIVLAGDGQGLGLLFELGKPLGQVAVRSRQGQRAYEGAHDLDLTAMRAAR